MTNPVPTPAPSSDSQATGFQQRLGLFDATMLVVGAMIGSGIFLVSADIALEVGSSGWLMLVWVLTGVMTVIGALSYAELAAMMPRAGGQYVYLRESYGPLWGFLYGWTLFMVIQTGSIAAVSVAFAKFLGVLVPDLGPAHILWEIGAFQISSGQLVAVVLTAFLTWLNTRGVEGGKWVQNVFTVAKMLGLGLLIVLGLTVAANSEVMTANWSNIWDGIFTTDQFTAVKKLTPAGNWLTALMVVGASMVGSLFSADAWNNVTFTAGETKNLTQSAAEYGNRNSACDRTVFALQRGVLGRAADSGSEGRSDRIGTRHRLRPRRPSRNGGARASLANVGRHADGDHDHDLDLRLRERAHLDGGAAVLRDGSGRFVLQEVWRTQRTRRTGVWTLDAGDLVDRAGVLGHF